MVTLRAAATRAARRGTGGRPAPAGPGRLVGAGFLLSFMRATVGTPELAAAEFGKKPARSQNTGCTLA